MTETVRARTDKLSDVYTRASHRGQWDMNPTGRFAIALIVLLPGQQALLGQVGPGYSSPYPENVDASSPTVLPPSRSNQPTAPGWRDNWTSLPDASLPSVEDVQPAVWQDCIGSAPAADLGNT